MRTKFSHRLLSNARRFAPATLLALLCVIAVRAAEFKGQVKFGGLAVPGATVTAKQGDRTLVAITDNQGSYVFPDLPDGAWNFDVEMLGFSPLKQDVTVAAGAAAPELELKMLTLDEMKAIAGPAQPPPRISVTTAPVETSQAAPSGGKNNAKNKKGATTAAANGQNSFQRTAVNANPNAAAPPPPAASAAAEAVPSNGAFGNQNAGDLSQRASDGLLINGTVNNGASSPFAQAAAFGNNRRGAASLYNGGLALILDNSTFDARSFSLTGQDTAKPDYSHVQGIFNMGGPIKIPHLINNGPIFFILYQWSRSRNANTQPYLVPTPEQRAGDFSLLGQPVYDPTTGAPFPGNTIPSNRISPQAKALLNYYPQPNFAGSTRYNFQIPLVGATHQDSIQSRLNKNVGNRNQFYGNFNLQRTATDSPNQFGFVDRSNTLGFNVQANWQHRFNQRLFAHFQVTFSRLSSTTTPNFAGRENVSAAAGIFGNNQDAVNWGPPTLGFASQITSLTDGIAAANHNQTTAFTYDSTWNHGRHNINFGADYRRLLFNYLTQQNPRGAFTFTGAYTAPPNQTSANGLPAVGSDFADFLLGVPDVSQIAFGNADKYFRAAQWDGFITDDWRIGPALTVLLGARWEYNAPSTELYGRIVNLDVAPGYSAVAPVVANNPVGPLTGQKYPDSLLQPDKHAYQPRVGLAWRPIPASSLVVRAGYGIYYNTSVYQSIALSMATQSPLSKVVSVQNTAANPLTLANGFNAPTGQTPNTFAVDPNFKVGYAQNWQISVQRDLPGSLVMTAQYLGIKGTRGPQEFLPNTYPAGAANPCLSCPSGFYYETSNGNSTRQSGVLQLRRRLHNGITASLNYTYSKSIDDSALGGRGQATTVIAQNWLDLSAERGLSNFDQRHLLAFQMQYTSGMGIGGGALLSGWRGTVLKEWTIASTINAGTGLPLTPIVQSAVVRGTGVPGTIRPDYTGAPLYDAKDGLFLNPDAYTVAPSGQWGNAGRDSITGPSQFSLNASLARTFRLKDRYTMDFRLDATNALNHVVYTSWGTAVGSTQFGVPAAANNMRSLQTTIRVRF